MKYIKDSSGKFAGSIGDGKNNLPTVHAQPFTSVSAEVAEDEARLNDMVGKAFRRIATQSRNPMQRRQHELMLAAKIANLDSTNSVDAAFLRDAVRRAENATGFGQWAPAQLDVLDGVARKLFPGASHVKFHRPFDMDETVIVEISDSSGRKLYERSEQGHSADLLNRVGVVGSLIDAFPEEAMKDYFLDVDWDNGYAYAHKIG